MASHTPVSGPVLSSPVPPLRQVWQVNCGRITTTKRSDPAPVGSVTATATTVATPGAGGRTAEAGAAAGRWPDPLIRTPGLIES